MPAGPITIVGLICCIASLGVQLFPDWAASLGADPVAAMRLFAFGVFLIALASMLTVITGARGR